MQGVTRIFPYQRHFETNTIKFKKKKKKNITIICLLKKIYFPSPSDNNKKKSNAWTARILQPPKTRCKTLT